MDYYDVDGFRFLSKEEYNAALKDKETIDYINKRFDFSNSKSVLNLYNKMVSENTFKTVVGQAYLKKLYDVLVKVPGMQKETLPMIIITEDKKEPRSNRGGNSKFYEKKIEKLTSQLGTYKIIVFFMVIIIVAMFVITLDNDSLNYNNAYNAVVDEYEGWEKELENREKELDEREKAIEDKENNQK